MQSIPNASPEMLRMAFIAMGSISILFAIAMIVLGVFVRRGGKGAIVTALVLNVIAVLLMLVYIAGDRHFKAAATSSRASAWPRCRSYFS